MKKLKIKKDESKYKLFKCIDKSKIKAFGAYALLIFSLLVVSISLLFTISFIGIVICWALVDPDEGGWFIALVLIVVMFIKYRELQKIPRKYEPWNTKKKYDKKYVILYTYRYMIESIKYYKSLWQRK
jgi:hypothetical protein